MRHAGQDEPVAFFIQAEPWPVNAVHHLAAKDAARNNFPDLIKIWRCPMVF